MEIGGPLGIGTTSPDRQIHAEVADSATNTTVYPIRMTHSSSATPTTSFGVGIELELENNNSEMLLAGVISSEWESAINNSEYSAISLKSLVLGNSFERLRLATSSSSFTSYSASTNTVEDCLDLNYFSLGGALAGFGAAFNLNLTNDNGDFTKSFSITSEWTDPNEGAEYAKANFYVMSNSDPDNLVLTLNDYGAHVNGSVSTKISTEAEIVATQDNYPTLGKSILRLTSGSSQNITGFADGVEGKRLTLINFGSDDIAIVGEDFSPSTEINRVINQGGGDHTILPNETAEYLYDSVSQRWRQV